MQALILLCSTVLMALLEIYLHYSREIRDFLKQSWASKVFRCGCCLCLISLSSWTLLPAVKMHNARQLVTKFLKTFNKFCIVSWHFNRLWAESLGCKSVRRGADGYKLQNKRPVRLEDAGETFPSSILRNWTVKLSICFCSPVILPFISWSSIAVDIFNLWRHSNKYKILSDKDKKPTSKQKCYRKEVREHKSLVSL